MVRLRLLGPPDLVRKAEPEFKALVASAKKAKS
jgi:hypothetical protein